MSRVYNFSAGPAVLPEEVLQEAADEMLDYRGCGMSVMEMSHRSKVFDDIIKDAEKDLRELMNIPDNYKVLFLQGGASQQFAAVPMNLMKNKKPLILKMLLLQGLLYLHNLYQIKEKMKFFVHLSLLQKLLFPNLNYQYYLLLLTHNCTFLHWLDLGQYNSSAL